jgi:hypothetical protein
MNEFDRVLAKVKDIPLEHSGVPGMKWGVRKAESNHPSTKAIKNFEAGARELTVAQWNYRKNRKNVKFEDVVKAHENLKKLQAEAVSMIKKHGLDKADYEDSPDNITKFMDAHMNVAAQDMKKMSDNKARLDGQVSKLKPFTGTVDKETLKAAETILNDRNASKDHMIKALEAIGIDEKGRQIKVPKAPKPTKENVEKANKILDNPKSTKAEIDSALELIGIDPATGKLKHSGVPGMKWGVRKASQVITGAARAMGYGRPGSKEANETKALKRKKLHELSNEDLKKLTQRMQLEQQYKTLKDNDQPDRIKALKKATQKYGEQAADQFVQTAATVGSQLLMQAIFEGVKAVKSHG